LITHKFRQRLGEISLEDVKKEGYGQEFQKSMVHPTKISVQINRHNEQHH
jgi:hypothetical protein